MYALIYTVAGIWELELNPLIFVLQERQNSESNIKNAGRDFIYISSLLINAGIVLYFELFKWTAN